MKKITKTKVSNTSIASNVSIASRQFSVIRYSSFIINHSSLLFRHFLSFFICFICWESSIFYSSFVIILPPSFSAHSIYFCAARSPDLAGNKPALIWSTPAPNLS